MKSALLDTNVLLALAWPNHQHHSAAHAWFAKNARKGWATCAFTQLGFIRLSSNPSYSEDAASPQDAAALLSEWTRHKNHHFLPSPSADKPEIFANAIGHQQVNDAWLIEVARSNSGYLATFDKRLKGHSVENGLIEIISG